MYNVDIHYTMEIIINGVNYSLLVSIVIASWSCFDEYISLDVREILQDKHACQATLY